MPKQERMRHRSIRWLVWLSLSLVLWTVAVESTHNHPSQAGAAACSICIVAHSASPAVSSGPTAPVFATVGLLQEEEVVAKAPANVLALGIRGPPTV
jgi:hypothetical protein